MAEADGLKQLRDGCSGGDSPGTLKSGDWPVRFRGYYRALKREAPWAIRLSKMSRMCFLLAWKYRLSFETIYTKNPFLEILPKDYDSGGAWIPIPINYGNKNGS